jgi:hypothetical protein
MTTTSPYGTIFGADQLEEAAKETLIKWMPTYLAEVERQRGMEPGEIPLPRSYRTVPRFDKFPEDQIPAIYLVSPGIFGEPVKRGGGVYQVQYSLGFAVVVETRDPDSVNTMAKLYSSAIVAAIMQHRNLGFEQGKIEGVDWVDETFLDIPTQDSRSLASAQGVFVIMVNDVLTVGAGPLVPDPEVPPIDPTVPPDPLPEVGITEIDISSEGV